MRLWIGRECLRVERQYRAELGLALQRVEEARVVRRPARALELAAELERLAVDLVRRIKCLDEGDMEDGGGDGLAQRLSGILASTIGAKVARIGADVEYALLGAEVGRDERA